MTRRLFGFLPGEDGEDVRLICLKSQGFEEVARPRDNDEIVLFVPGTDVSIFQRALPTKGERQSRQAAPFTIEDDVANPIDDLHIALGAEPNDLADVRDLQVVERALMEVWTETLGKNGLSNNTQLVAEQSVLADGELIDLGPRIVGSLSSGPFAFDKELPRDVLVVLLQDETTTEIPTDNPLVALAERYEKHDGQIINLRQGSFATRNSLSFDQLQEWRLAASLLVACAIAVLASGYADISAKHATAEQIRTEISTSYSRAFPEAPNPTDPVRAISRALGDANSGPAMDFLDTSAVLYAALAEVPNASLRGVRYDPRRGGYVASVAYIGYGDDAALQTALEDRGYSATLGDARRGGEYVFGDVTLSAGASQ